MALALLPTPALRATVRHSLAGRHLALCLHRVGDRRRDDDPIPQLTIPASQLDELLGLLQDSRPERRGWLTVAFDDGYASAANYIRSRAEAYGTVEWLFFVCPEKAEKRVGFRWDAFEALVQKKAATRPMYEQFMIHDLNPERENARPDLVAAGSDRRHALATIEECRSLALLPNVTLGNHTNIHLPFSLLEPAAVRSEIRRSNWDHHRLFGPCRQFSIPFGTPGLEFSAAHVEELRSGWDGVIWSTERRPYAPAEREPGAVLPRFAVDGTWNARRTAASIAVSALQARLRYSSFSNHSLRQK